MCPINYQLFLPKHYDDQPSLKVTETLHLKPVSNLGRQKAYFRCYCWWFINPKQPPGMYKTLLNSGINYQPQLVSQFWTINSMLVSVSFRKKTFRLRLKKKKQRWPSHCASICSGVPWKLERKQIKATCTVVNEPCFCELANSNNNHQQPN